VAVDGQVVNRITSPCMVADIQVCATLALTESSGAFSFFRIACYWCSVTALYFVYDAHNAFAHRCYLTARQCLIG
jgi:hypothetical protein